jgi:dCMP deaminase
MITQKDIKYMKLCAHVAESFSTCSKKKYGSVLLDANNHVVGMGYNGGPSNIAHCVDGGCPRLFDKSSSGSIYDNCIAIHAEQNALLHCNYLSRPIKMYVNGPPCFTCAKLIANSTIKDVYYIPDKDYKNWNSVSSLLSSCNINLNKVEKWQLEN